MTSINTLQRAVGEILRRNEFEPRVRRGRSAGEFVGAIVDNMVPVIAAWPVKDAPAPGRSKIGGRPDLPADLPWPVTKPFRGGPGVPLGFVAQLDLAEFAGFDEQGRLPADGVLYLFSVIDGDTAYGWNIDHANTAVIYLPESGLSAPRDIPDAAPSVAERPLAFAASLLCEERWEDDDEDDEEEDEDEPRRITSGYRWRRFDAGVERAVEEALVEAGSHDPEIAILTNKWFMGEQAEQMIEENDVELICLPGAFVSPVFGGEGYYHVVIDKDALAAGKLDEAWAFYAPGS